MTREQEVAWAAGLFEGEGCIALHGAPRRRIRLTLSSTDHDVVRRFHRIIGVGAVSKPHWHSGSTKPQVRWGSAAAADVTAAIELLEPFLGERRLARLNECRDIVAAQGPKVPYQLLRTHCRNGHPVSEENTIRWGGKGPRRCRVCEKTRWDRKNAAKRVTAEDVAGKIAGLV